MKKFILLVMFVLMPSFCSATDYYIKNGGDDTLSGLSDENAWATIERLSQQVLQPNDVVNFKRGDIWNEQTLFPKSGSELGYITYKSYGEGNYPVLSVPYHANIIGGSPQYVIIENFHLTKGSRHGIGFQSGTSNIIIRDNEISWIGGGRDKPDYERLGNGIEFWEQTTDVLVENNYIHDIYDAAITNQGLANGYTQNNIVYQYNTIERAHYHYEFFAKGKGVEVSNISIINNVANISEPSWGDNLRFYPPVPVQLWDTDMSKVDINISDNIVLR